MMIRCKHGLLEGQCSVCRREAARAEAKKAQLDEKRAKNSDTKGTES